MSKLTNLKRLLSVLKDGQWHTGDELAAKVSLHFQHTVYEARKKGYLIELKKVGHNQFEYRLIVASSIS